MFALLQINVNNVFSENSPKTVYEVVKLVFLELVISHLPHQSK